MKNVEEPRVSFIVLKTGKCFTYYMPVTSQTRQNLRCCCFKIPIEEKFKKECCKLQYGTRVRRNLKAFVFQDVAVRLSCIEDIYHLEKCYLASLWIMLNISKAY